MDKLKRMAIGWLRSQWLESLARDIWCDMTPLGRATLFLPCWLICWLIFPFILISGGLMWMVGKVVWRPVDWLYHRFFY